MKKNNEYKVAALSMDEMEQTDGGFIHIVYGAYLCHKALVAMYGAAKVYGFYAGAASVGYLAS
ncbi:class IIb bacteriocin, lactobin A/cerein 7B family [Balneolaceae bacterium ANBcel3]|nr:class IIb bacteriocin, lactobin A/cerein 7B family [Balneolaceae bacterium ANBcel3]